MNKNFEELLKALNDAEAETDEVLAQAKEPVDPDLEDDPEDDEMIAAAAGEGAPAPAAAPAAAGDEDGEFGKSFEFTDAAGNKQQAVDATELVKSLIDRQDTTETVLAKAMNSMTSLVQKQGDLIKSLTQEVRSLSAQGRGRKTMLNVAEKPDAGVLAKSQGAAADGMTTQEFFAKANAAFDAEKISGKDLNVISVCLRSNHAIDPELIQRVVSA